MYNFSGSIIDDLDFGNSLPLIETRTAMCVGGPDGDASRSCDRSCRERLLRGYFTGYTEFGGKRKRWAKRHVRQILAVGKL